MLKTTLIAGAAALTLGLGATSGQAQNSYNYYGSGYAPSASGYAYNTGFRGGYYGGGYYGRGYAPVAYRGYNRGYYRAGYRGYPRYAYRRPARGAAVAAGLVGGLALGLGALAAQPAYAYGYGPYAPATRFYAGPAYYGADCFVTRERVVNRRGRVVVRDVQTCN